jgi:hypothetical protein
LRTSSDANRPSTPLSAGHGLALLYAFLHMSGYDLTVGDLRRFRQWGSRTPAIRSRTSRLGWKRAPAARARFRKRLRDGYRRSAPRRALRPGTATRSSTIAPSRSPGRRLHGSGDRGSAVPDVSVRVRLLLASHRKKVAALPRNFFEA